MTGYNLSCTVAKDLKITDQANLNYFKAIRDDDSKSGLYTLKHTRKKITQTFISTTAKMYDDGRTFLEMEVSNI